MARLMYVMWEHEPAIIKAAHDIDSDDEVRFMWGILATWTRPICNCKLENRLRLASRRLLCTQSRRYPPPRSVSKGMRGQ